MYKCIYSYMAKPLSLPRPAAPRKKATFNLDASLHQRLKVAAARHRREMGDLVTEALRRHLGDLEKRKKTA